MTERGRRAVPFLLAGILVMIQFHIALALCRLARRPLLSSWERGHLGRLAGWKPAPLKPPAKDPRHHRHDPAPAESFLIPSWDV